MKPYLEYKIELEEIAGDQFGTIKHLSESIFDGVMSWDCGNHIFECGADYLHGHYGAYDDAITLLSKEMHPH